MTFLTEFVVILADDPPKLVIWYFCFSELVPDVDGVVWRLTRSSHLTSTKVAWWVILASYRSRLPFTNSSIKPVPCPAGGLAERGLDLMPSPFGVGMGSPFKVR